MFLSQDSLDGGNSNNNHINNFSAYIDDSIFASPSSKRGGVYNNDTIFMDQLPEEHIPDVLAKSLMRNFKAGHYRYFYHSICIL